MKRILSVIAVLALVFCVMQWSGPSRETLVPGQFLGEISYTYNTPEGMPMELVFSSYSGGRSDLVLRVSGSAFQDREVKLARMRAEVVRLVSSREPVRISDEVKLIFHGSSPVWGPHMTVGLGYEYLCLLFANGVRLENGLLTAHGIADGEKPLYYPYPPITKG